MDAYRKVVMKKDYLRPWAIIRLLPNAKTYIIARFYNRQDAHDHLRVLNRFMPTSEFETIFDDQPPEELR